MVLFYGKESALPSITAKEIKKIMENVLDIGL